MLDSLLGRGFSSKCKSLIKLTKSRIDVIRRKRNATQKFLKKDVADLLSNGLDINAYGRADGLLAELTLSSCYDCIEQTCDFVLKHLSVIQKQRECPEECREAVSSLMFAAARFSDLPELRDLRQMFQERYGNSLEYFANKEFVEKLSSKPAKMENKVQLMRDIASEFSIRWDSVAFEQRMSNPSASAKGQNKNYGSFHVPVDNDRSVNTKDAAQKHKFAHKERIELPPKYDRCSHDGKEGYVSKRTEIDLHSRREVTENGHASLNGTKETVVKNDDGVSSFRGRQEITVERHGPWNQKEEATPRKVRLGSSSHKKGQELTDDGSKIPNGRENIFPKRIVDVVPVGYSEFDRNFAQLPLKSDSRDTQFAGSKYGGQDNTANSTGNGCDKEVEKVRPYYNNAIPPPYVKPNSKPKDDKYRANLGSSHADFGSDRSRSTGNRSERVQLGDHSDNERHVGLVRTNGHVHEKDHHRQDDVTGNPLPKPKSVRRRHSRSRSGHDDVGNSEDTADPARKSRSKRRDDSKRGLQILFGDEQDEKDEEERVIDRLLMHYRSEFSTKMAMASSSTLVSSIILSLVVVLAHRADARPSTSRPRAFFVFGDSLVDSGNNDFLVTTARADSPPYGIDYPTRRPTGRFSNGYNIPDLISQRLGSESVLPYLNPQINNGRKLLLGANFASAGIGILNDTGVQFLNIIRMYRQLEYFQEYQRRVSAMVGSAEAKRLVNRALVLITCGGNDFVNNYYLVPYSARSRQFPNIADYVKYLMKEYKKLLQKLYELGARRVLVTGSGPMGCVPAELAQRGTNGGCSAELQKAASLYNPQLNQMLRELNRQYGGTIFIAANTDKMHNDFVDNPRAFGFVTSKIACCGQGPYNGLGLCTPASNLCSNRELYAFWDAFHPSEKANKLIVEGIMSGNTDIMSPMNLSTILALDAMT